jgi:hypothetical protein
MAKHAYERVKNNLEMPGIIILSQTIKLSLAVEEIRIVLACATKDELKNTVRWIPLT